MAERKNEVREVRVRFNGILDASNDEARNDTEARENTIIYRWYMDVILFFFT